jgi:hypothetical protein
VGDPWAAIAGAAKYPDPAVVEDMPMERPFGHITFTRQGEVFCVALLNRKLSETEIIEMADEVVSLIIDQGCRRLAFRLGPEPFDCLYSIFLAKLVMIRRRLRECNGQMRLCDVPEAVMGIFEACRLHKYFEFEPTQEEAIKALSPA